MHGAAPTQLVILRFGQNTKEAAHLEQLAPARIKIQTPLEKIWPCLSGWQRCCANSIPVVLTQVPMGDAKHCWPPPHCRAAEAKGWCLRTYIHTTTNDVTYIFSHSSSPKSRCQQGNTSSKCSREEPSYFFSPALAAKLQSLIPS